MLMVVTLGRSSGPAMTGFGFPSSTSNGVASCSVPGSGWGRGWSRLVYQRLEVRSPRVNRRALRYPASQRRLHKPAHRARQVRDGRVGHDVLVRVDLDGAHVFDAW